VYSNQSQYAEQFRMSPVYHKTLNLLG